MQNETRVNLKHLLEDMRDSFSAPLEEVILTELMANALDSKATRIDFTVNHAERFLRCVDNGLGMKRPALKEYHNIAASEKVRGQGIGFAGVGAKLSLLLAEFVAPEKHPTEFLAKFLSSWSAIDAEGASRGQAQLL